MTIDERLKATLLDVSEQAITLQYFPTRFIQMIHEQGAVATAKSLLSDTDVQSGLIRLWELNRLDLSLEAQVLNAEFADLFSDEERRSARERLEKLGYKPNANDP